MGTQRLFVKLSWKIFVRWNLEKAFHNLWKDLVSPSPWKTVVLRPGLRKSSAGIFQLKIAKMCRKKFAPRLRRRYVKNLRWRSAILFPMKSANKLLRKFQRKSARR